MNDAIDVFIKSITHSVEQSVQFTVEADESEAIRIDSGIDEGTAFREAVREVFEKWKIVDKEG